MGNILQNSLDVTYEDFLRGVFGVKSKPEWNALKTLFSGIVVGKSTLVSGFCAGLLPVYVPAKDKCSEGQCGSNYFWNLCCNTATECNRTAAYGKWTLIWDSDIASKVGTKLTDTSVKTAWGEATPVPLKDARSCKEAACAEKCGE